MHDLHTKIEQGNRLWYLHDELAKAAGQDPDKVTTPAFLCALDFYKKAQNSFRYRSKHFDRPIEEGKKPDLGILGKRLETPQRSGPRWAAHRH
jgi:hypothetical protein